MNSLTCDQCGTPISVPPDAAEETYRCSQCGREVPVGSRDDVTPSGSTDDEIDQQVQPKMRWSDYCLAVLLPPIACGLAVAWLAQGFRKAWIMLLVAVPLTCVWFACVLGYVMYYAPGTNWSDAAEVEAGIEGKADQSGATDMKSERTERKNSSRSKSGRKGAGRAKKNNEGNKAAKS